MSSVPFVMGDIYTLYRKGVSFDTSRIDALLAPKISKLPQDTFLQSIWHLILNKTKSPFNCLLSSYILSKACAQIMEKDILDPSHPLHQDAVVSKITECVKLILSIVEAGVASGSAAVSTVATDGDATDGVCVTTAGDPASVIAAVVGGDISQYFADIVDVLEEVDAFEEIVAKIDEMFKFEESAAAAAATAASSVSDVSDVSDVADVAKAVDAGIVDKLPDIIAESSSKITVHKDDKKKMEEQCLAALRGAHEKIRSFITRPYVVKKKVPTAPSADTEPVTAGLGISLRDIARFLVQYSDFSDQIAPIVERLQEKDGDVINDKWLQDFEYDLREAHAEIIMISECAGDTNALHTMLQCYTQVCAGLRVIYGSDEMPKIEDISQIAKHYRSVYVALCNYLIRAERTKNQALFDKITSEFPEILYLFYDPKDRSNFLHIAAKRGNQEIVDTILTKAKFLVDARNVHKKSPYESIDSYDKAIGEKISDVHKSIKVINKKK